MGNSSENIRKKVRITIDGETYEMDNVLCVIHQTDGSVSVLEHKKGIVKVFGPGCYEEITVLDGDLRSVEVGDGN